MKKMFAGIVGIEFDEESRLVSAILSREGEKVELSPAVNLNDVSKVNDWLRKLEQAMQATLSSLLSASLVDFGKFDVVTLDYQGFMQWIDRYPV